jgi:hypothetical protein
MKRTGAAALAGLAIILMAGECTAAPLCAPSGSEAAAVKVVSEMYAAAEVDDEAGFRSTITHNFYAYDNGRRFDGMELFNLIKTLHSQGNHFQWKVTEPVATVSCDLALVTYVNQGAIGEGKALSPMRWLESAALRYEDGQWRIGFMQSQRAAQ